MQQLIQVITDKERWRNPALYVALLAYVPMALAFFHVQLAPDQWAMIEKVVKVVIEALTFFGILMNPKTRGFGDEQ